MSKRKKKEKIQVPDKERKGKKVKTSQEGGRILTMIILNRLFVIF